MKGLAAEWRQESVNLKTDEQKSFNFKNREKGMLKRLVSGTTETFSKGLVYIPEEERKNEAEKQSESKQHKLSQIW